MRLFLRSILMIVFMGTMFVSNGHANDDGWRKAKDARGVVIHTRRPEGSAVKEFKAQTIVKAPLNAIVAVLFDIESYPRWYKNTGKTKVLEKINDRKQLYYYEVLVSFPFRNRDMVETIEFSQDPNTKVVTAKITNVKDHEYAQKGRVRMPIADGSWTLTPMDNGEVKVEHQFLADPGGSIPKQIVNMLIVGGPYASLLKLNKFVHQAKYRDTKFEWLQN